jgi:hypothetical protein
MIGSFAADAEMRMHVEPKVLRLLVYSSIYMNCAYSASLAVWRRSHGQISTEKRRSRQGFSWIFAKSPKLDSRISDAGNGRGRDDHR